jgi:hypothetical protein
MTPLFAKLGLKDRTAIVVLGAPPEFEPALAALAGSVKVHRRPLPATTFALAFVKTHSELAAAAGALLPQVAGDAVLWLAYPKGTSKRHKSEINRDSAWAPLGEAGFEAVSQVAIDADWSALRFRHCTFIKTMTRHPAGAISAAGKARTGKTAAVGSAAPLAKAAAPGAQRARSGGGVAAGEGGKGGGGCPPKSKKQRLI